MTSFIKTAGLGLFSGVRALNMYDIPHNAKVRGAVRDASSNFSVVVMFLGIGAKTNVPTQQKIFPNYEECAKNVIRQKTLHGRRGVRPRAGGTAAAIHLSQETYTTVADELRVYVFMP